MANLLFNQLILIDKETREPFGKELVQMEEEANHRRFMREHKTGRAGCCHRYLTPCQLPNLLHIWTLWRIGMDFVRHWGTSYITSITLQHNTMGDEFQSCNTYPWHLKCAGDSVEPGDRAVGSERKGTMCSDTLQQPMRWFTRLVHTHMLDAPPPMLEMPPLPPKRNKRVVNGARRAGLSGDCNAIMGHQRKYVTIKLTSFISTGEET